MIYLDVLLLVNFALALLFLLGAGLLSGQSCTPLRLIAGGGTAALSSLALLLPALPGPLAFLYKAATAALTLWLAYGWHGGRNFGQLAVWYGLLNLLLAGAVLLPGARTNNFSCYLPLSPGVLLSSAAILYMILQFVLHFLGRATLQTRPARLTLAAGDTRLSVSALRDTGFSVQEPLSGRTVVLVRYSPLRAQLSGPLRAYLDAEFSGQAPLPPPELGVRLVPCTTVAGRCILPAVPARELTVRARTHDETYSNLYAAFCDTPPPPGGWTLLMGG